MYKPDPELLIALETYDVIGELDKHGYAAKEVGGRTEFLLSSCPFCGKDEHLGVQPTSNFFGCYKCGQKGSIPYLLARASGQPIKIILQQILGNKRTIDSSLSYGLSTESFDSAVSKVDANHLSALEQVGVIDFPEGYIPLQDNEFFYAQKRGITNEQVDYYKIGICNSGQYAGRMIVCDVDANGNPVYFMGRDYTGAGSPKVKNPSIEVPQPFNWVLASQFKKIVIVEGIFDALHIGYNALSLYGKNFARWKTHLLSSKFDEIVLLFDGDVQDHSFYSAARELITFTGPVIKGCTLPTGDPDEVQKEILLELIEKASILTGGVPSLPEF